MITNDLYEQVLVQPAREQGNVLSIISGYASAAFAADHLQDMLTMQSRPVVRIIVGMFPHIGSLRSNHLAFQQLSTTDYPIGFECRYVVTLPRVHTKAYAWYKNGEPLRGFTGSANYSRNGFVQQREAVEVSDAQEVQNYFDSLWEVALDCREPEADRLVAEAIAAYKSRKPQADVIEEPTEAEIVTLPHKKLSLLRKDNLMYNAGGGLNWGQPTPKRPGRNRNEAYIAFSTEIARSGFFPPREQHFTITTDDDKSLICVLAHPKKKGATLGHGIETPLDNSQMGLYFRNRLGLADGAFVTKQDLENYGRTDVDIYKVNDDDYQMDFSVQKPNNP